MEPYFSEAVMRKLKEKHSVAVSEVIQCFANRLGRPLTDNRPDHRTDPPTRWFIAETDMGRKLKVVYMLVDSSFEVKTAYEPNAIELEIHRKVTGVCF